jgi:hypothetical protein
LKWNKHLTADEAAGLAVGLNYPVSEEPQVPNGHPEDDEMGHWADYYAAMEALEIYNALTREIYIWVSGELGGGGEKEKTIIDVSRYTIHPETNDIEPTSVLITRQSIGNWFCSFGQMEKALLINHKAEKEFAKWKSSQEPASETPSVNANPSSKTPTNSLVEAVGLMALLLAKKSTKFKSGGNPNSSRISSEVDKMARELFGLSDSDRTGLSNLQKDISEGVKAVNKRIEQLK